MRNKWQQLDEDEKEIDYNAKNNFEEISDKTSNQVSTLKLIAYLLNELLEEIRNHERKL